MPADSKPASEVRRPLIVETTARYVVWVYDYDGEGAEVLARRENDEIDGDLIRNATAFDGGWTVTEPDAYGDWDEIHSTQHGPWQLCPWPGCEVQQYPAYSLGPTCHDHRVTGCQFRNLPTKEFA